MPKEPNTKAPVHLGISQRGVRLRIGHRRELGRGSGRSGLCRHHCRSRWRCRRLLLWGGLGCRCRHPAGLLQPGNPLQDAGLPVLQRVRGRHARRSLQLACGAAQRSAAQQARVKTLCPRRAHPSAGGRTTQPLPAMRGPCIKICGCFGLHSSPPSPSLSSTALNRCNRASMSATMSQLPDGAAQRHILRGWDEGNQLSARSGGLSHQGRGPHLLRPPAGCRRFLDGKRVSCARNTSLKLIAQWRAQTAPRWAARRCSSSSSL